LSLCQPHEHACAEEFATQTPFVTRGGAGVLTLVLLLLLLLLLLCAV
jgi:hypothetical protein